MKPTDKSKNESLLDKYFEEYNRENIKLLAEVPSKKIILVAEEITGFSMGWKEHGEILIILNQMKIT